MLAHRQCRGRCFQCKREVCAPHRVRQSQMQPRSRDKGQRGLCGSPPPNWAKIPSLCLCDTYRGPRASPPPKRLSCLQSGVAAWDSLALSEIRAPWAMLVPEGTSRGQCSRWPPDLLGSGGDGQSRGLGSWWGGALVLVLWGLTPLSPPPQCLLALWSSPTTRMGSTARRAC